MSIQSSIETSSQLPHPFAVYDPEEETVVPPLALGYSNPPAGSDEVLGHASFFDVSARPLPAPPLASELPVGPVPDDADLLEAAVGQHRRQVAMTALAVSGLALGICAALLV